VRKLLNVKITLILFNIVDFLLQLVCKILDFVVTFLQFCNFRSYFIGRVQWWPVNVTFLIFKLIY